MINRVYASFLLTTSFMLSPCSPVSAAEKDSVPDAISKKRACEEEEFKTDTPSSKHPRLDNPNLSPDNQNLTGMELVAEIPSPLNPPEALFQYWREKKFHECLSLLKNDPELIRHLVPADTHNMTLGASPEILPAITGDEIDKASKLIVYIFKTNPEVGRSVYNQMTILAAAINEDDRELIQSLIAGNLNIFRIRDEVGQNALHYACHTKHLAMVQYILDFAPQLAYEKDSKSETPLAKALNAGNTPVVKFLYQNKPDLFWQRYMEPENLYSWVFDDKLSLPMPDLYHPSLSNNLYNGLAVLLKFYFMNKESEEIISLLMEKPELLADVNILASYWRGDYIAQLAASYGMINVVKHALKADDWSIYKESRYGKTIFDHAAETGQLEIVKILFEENPLLLGHKCAKGMTIFHYACMSDNPELLEYLYGLNPGFLIELDAEGNTPLHIATMWGNLTLSTYLLGKILDSTLELSSFLKVKNSRGNTIFDLATLAGSVDLIALLLEYEPDLEAHDIDICTGVRLLMLANKEQSSTFAREVLSSIKATDALTECLCILSRKYYTNPSSPWIVKLLLDTILDRTFNSIIKATKLTEKASMPMVALGEINAKIEYLKKELESANFFYALASDLGKSNIDFLAYILETFPQNWNQEDDVGMTLLRAVIKDGPLESVKWFSRNYREQFYRVTKEGETLLHLTTNSSIIAFLVNEYPELLKQPDNHGLLPLHTYVLHPLVKSVYLPDDYYQTVLKLFIAYPQGLLEKTTKILLIEEYGDGTEEITLNESSTPIDAANAFEETKDLGNYLTKLQAILPLLPPSYENELASVLKSLNSSNRRLYNKFFEKLEQSQDTATVENSIPPSVIKEIEALMKVELSLFSHCLHQYPLNRSWENQKIRKLEELKQSLFASLSTEERQHLESLQEIYRDHLNPSLKDLVVDSVKKQFLASNIRQTLKGNSAREMQPLMPIIEAFQQAVPFEEQADLESAPSYVNTLYDIWRNLSPGTCLHTLSPAEFVKKLRQILGQRE